MWSLADPPFSSNDKLPPQITAQQRLRTAFDIQKALQEVDRLTAIGNCPTKVRTHQQNLGFNSRGAYFGYNKTEEYQWEKQEQQQQQQQQQQQDQAQDQDQDQEQELEDQNRDEEQEERANRYNQWKHDRFNEVSVSLLH